MSIVRDLQLAKRAKAHGAKSSLRIVREARRVDLPISLAFALVDQESEFHNIFGADQKSILAHQEVTKARVQELIAHVRDGGISNGVGYTQLTDLGFILEAEREGGAHIIKNQLRVGFRALARGVHTSGVRRGLSTYNSGHPYSRLGNVYANKVIAKQRHWHAVLEGKA